MENHRANLIGSGGLSQFEADVSRCLVAISSFNGSPPPQTLTQAYKKDLHKFDTQRVIVAWDGLISKQQAALGTLGVPVMYVTDLTSDREVSAHVHMLPSPSDFVSLSHTHDRRLPRPLNPTEATAHYPGT